MMANKELRKRRQFDPRYYVKLINARNIDHLSENTFGELSVIIIIEHVELMLKTCNTVFVQSVLSSLADCQHVPIQVAMLLQHRIFRIPGVPPLSIE